MHVHVRIARALFTPDMPTTNTLRCLTHEETVALVAVSPDPLPHSFADDILTASFRGHRHNLLDPLWPNYQLPISAHHSDTTCRCSNGLGLSLNLLHRVSGALLATSVLAILALLVGPKDGLAAMTGATDPQTDRLLNSLSASVRKRDPLIRLESKPIFRKQRACLLLLQLASRLFRRLFLHLWACNGRCLRDGGNRWLCRWRTVYNSACDQITESCKPT